LQPENPDKTEILSAFAWRLGVAADEARMSQAEIASRLGTTPSRVGNWFQAANFPRRADARRLADLLGVTVDWLLEGTGEKSRLAVAEDAGSYGDSAVREIPVISWSHAGEAATYEEMPKHWQGRVATTSRDRKAFAVIVEGDCMEPKFLPGDRVVLEPHAELRNGKPVVAKLVDDAVQLRIYTKLPSGAIRLASLKPEIYPTIEYKLGDFHWIYPVRELVRSV
jgi:phage repressor protein C with HTH and peptisase S24 domain